MGVIKTLKDQYKNEVNRQKVAAFEAEVTNFTISVLDCSFILRKIWSKESYTKSCAEFFRKAGFIMEEDDFDAIDYAVDEDSDYYSDDDRVATS